MLRIIFCVFSLLVTNIIVSQERIYPISIVDTPPLFKTCTQFSDFQKINCFENVIKSHINENIKFPQEAFEIGVSGRVFIYFIIDKNGKIEQIRSRGPHPSLELEAERIITILPNLSPAIKDNTPVKVSYSLPIDFFLLSRPSSQDIRAYAGANIYSEANSKSKILAIIKSNSLWSAFPYGEFWQINYFGGVGYISNEDASESNLDSVSYKEKNDSNNILETDLEYEGLVSQNTKNIIDDYENNVTKNLAVNVEKNQKDTPNTSDKDISLIEINKGSIISNSNTSTSESLILNTIPDNIDKLQNNDSSKENGVIENNLEISISENSTHLESIIKDYNNDISRLSYYEEKLRNQKDINRKVPGINQADLYYTNALNKFTKMLSQDIDIKYTILSSEYPDIFKNTKFKVKKIKTAKLKAEELRSKTYTISNSFFNKEFGSPPDDVNVDRLQILVDEMNKFNYLKFENISNLIDDSIDLKSTPKMAVNNDELIINSDLNKENIKKVKEEITFNDLDVDLKIQKEDKEPINSDQLSETSSEDQNEIKEELEEVREMLSEMREMIQINNNQVENNNKEEEEVNINDLAQDLINGNISQDEFFENLKLLDETKDNNELKSSIDNLKTLDEFLNLNILTQSIKMKSELLKSISEVNNESEISSSNTSEKNELVCTDFTSFNYTDGRQNIVSSEKFNITNNSDEITIYPILGSSKSSILVNIKIEGKDMCFDSDSKILISFRDGSRTEINHESYDNCDGETVIFLGRIFGEKAFQDLNELKYKEIQSIRVWMKNSLKEVTFSRIQSQNLMFTIDCLSSYMN